MTINTAGSDYDTVLSVFTGECGDTAQVARSDDVGGGDLTSRIVLLAVNGGTRYLVKVSDFNTSDGGGLLDFNLFFDNDGPGVPNDTCATATPINTPVYNNSQNTACADCAAGESVGMCAGFTNTVYYSFHAAQSGTVTINTNGSSYDTVLAVFTGGCADPGVVACNDDGGVDSLIANLPVQAGTSYGIVVGDFGFSQPGGGTLDLNFAFSACLADWNNDGAVNSNDYFAFLEDYFAGTADVTGDGVTNSNDYFAFLALCFDGCA